MNVTTLGGGRGWLDYAAAVSLWRLDARIGRLWQISEAGRTWAQQNVFRQAYLRGEPGAAFALPAGTSIHEQGRAIDTNDRIVWLINENGWFQTALARGEPWHFEYDWTRDQHYYEGVPAGDSATPFEITPEAPDEQEEEDMTNNRAGVWWSKNGGMSVLIYDTVSKWKQAYWVGNDSTGWSYNEAQRQIHGLPVILEVTESHAQVLLDSLNAPNLVSVVIEGGELVGEPGAQTPPKA